VLAKDLGMNKRRVSVGIPTLSCYDKLYRLCNHLLNDEHPCIEAEVLIIDNGGSFLESLYAKELQKVKSPNFTVAVAPFNFGVAKSWNYLINQLGQCIIANDDVVFGLNDIAAFLEAADANPGSIILETNDPVGGFSTFYVNRPERWLDMGGFDELFAPAYFEDNDCRWRLNVEQNSTVKVNLPSWKHENSSTLNTGDDRYKRMHWCCFERNKAYYQTKWGGLPGQEQFTTPFGK
jgi:GT2 family glycosyltransferase